MSSKRHLRKRLCQYKQRYVTEREAKLALVGMKKWLVATCLPYHCKFCGGWHIGRQSLKVAIARGFRA